MHRELQDSASTILAESSTPVGNRIPDRGSFFWICGLTLGGFMVYLVGTTHTALGYYV